MKISERVAYRHPLPRGPVYEILQIDDHIVIIDVPFSRVPRPLSLPSRDRHIMKRATAAYKHAGLRENHDKRFDEQTSATVLGGTIDGITGFLSAPP